MRVLTLIWILLCTTDSILASGDPKYPISAIKEELKKDVNVVYRLDHTTFTIHGRSRATQYTHEVITILNEKGKRFASEAVYYDKLSKIKDFNGSVYDANGKLIKRLKNSEIADQSAFDGFTLYSDARLKTIDLSQGAYPYTVEWEYEIELKYLFEIPDFYVSGEDVSVENASFVLKYVTDVKPRYKTINISQQPKFEKFPDGSEQVTWEFWDVKPVSSEPHGPPTVSMLPAVIAAPSVFEYDTYVGNMNSWNEFGHWIASLNKDRDVLPEATKQKIKQLVANAKTTEEKTRILYDYLQSKTRYVSIQLGIGGYQPFEASVVDQYGYGDCKALSNYMIAVLREAGVKSYYALAYAGSNYRGLDTSFPRSQFNHAIVAVPNSADTIWLECTSQTNPFGYQGLFTGDRKALLITEGGAAVVNTTRYSAEQNLQSRLATVVLSLNGDATAKVTTRYEGIQYENDGLDNVLTSQYDDQKKWIEKTTKIPSFEIRSFSMKNHRNRMPEAVVHVDLNLRRLATVSGKRIFLSPNLMNRSIYIPPKVESRKTDIYRKNAFTDVDTIIYQLPEQFYLEHLPENISLKSRFGEYEASYRVEAGSLIYIRRLRMNKGVFPASSYNEFVEFYKGINKADNTKLVFMTKT
jgi:transglutaminase-like putative cysteine protease